MDFREAKRFRVRGGAFAVRRTGGTRNAAELARSRVARPAGQARAARRPARGFVIGGHAGDRPREGAISDLVAVQKNLKSQITKWLLFRRSAARPRTDAAVDLRFHLVLPFVSCSTVGLKKGPAPCRAPIYISSTRGRFFPDFFHDGEKSSNVRNVLSSQGGSCEISRKNARS